MAGFFISTTGKTIVRTPRSCGDGARYLADEILTRRRVTFDQLLAKGRSPAVHAARVEVVKALWATGRYSQSDIARFIGRHPSSINLLLHGRKARPWAERKRAA